MVGQCTAQELGQHGRAAVHGWYAAALLFWGSCAWELTGTFPSICLEGTLAQSHCPGWGSAPLGSPAHWPILAGLGYCTKVLRW